MYYIIDHQDSFVHNIVACFRQQGRDVVVHPADRLEPSLILEPNLQGIVLSSGPGLPQQADVQIQWIQQYKHRVPILGIGLGHQILAHAFGVSVHKGAAPMHGKISQIHHRGKRLFDQLPPCFSVTRYHSFVVDEEEAKPHFWVDAHSQDGAVMAISHKTWPLYGVQFHPEAVLTQFGPELFANFHNICTDWWVQNENNPAVGAVSSH